ncbi:MAG: transporter substrate-binding domain-containing protein [Paracoccaceae bacterium]|jgi:polar amino acid transport system substrate-binding protein|uniref:transporter substrate-binding domain-containing protein n=1 Tax=unclassified Seohaeicola TaxID=2641111 RepID=UPI00237B89EA|nr:MULTISPECIES: transporter substrate-binding domain-containing protein [unclassified Seohaeicola]MDD9706880.1 transporter substrate-binding domain-containing protein [Seohaeicola sp. 4SK31]MDD9735116.1 transporter substrate-binding domain-containing protein [Seohaeicola sp. SP36]MDF1709832.1 transporter substrate-binding domain-containing protein [Paracoccaceae bacterium]MDM7968611.1 transporter substrate-binding domain-containing protein [Paracoccaceae bacterium]
MKTLILTTAALALTAGMALAQSQTIRMGTEGAYPPYNFLNDKGEVDGFEREVGDELCKRAELTCEWVTTDWDGIIPNLVSGNYDTIIAGMSITAERDEVIDFTQNYFPPAASAYVGLTADIDVTSAVVSAQASTIQAGHVAASGATLLEFATPEETVASVRNGEADAVFADKDYLIPIVEESGGELSFVGEDVQLGGGIGIGLRESDTELRAKFDAAIQSMKDDGTLNTLITKWFGEDAATF